MRMSQNGWSKLWACHNITFERYRPVYLNPSNLSINQSLHTPPSNDYSYPHNTPSNSLLTSRRHKQDRESCNGFSCAHLGKHSLRAVLNSGAQAPSHFRDPLFTERWFSICAWREASAANDTRERLYVKEPVHTPVLAASHLDEAHTCLPFYLLHYSFLPSNGALGTSVPYKRSGHIPGYGGYVAHSTLVAGRTFGEVRARLPCVACNGVSHLPGSHTTMCTTTACRRPGEH